MNNTFIFRSAPSPEDASIEEIRKVCDLLTQRGELRVAYRLDAPNRVTDDDMVVDLSIRALKYRIAPFGIDIKVGTPTVVGREFNGNFLDVHVMLESNVIRFNKGPWMFTHVAGMENELRQMLYDRMRVSRPFMLVFSVDDLVNAEAFSNHVDVQKAWIKMLERLGFTSFKLRVVRQDWPFEWGDKCRIDIRIEPKPTRKNLDPKGGRLTLMSRNHDRDCYSPASVSDVEHILNEFESGGYWSVAFGASVEDARMALSSFDSAAALIREWLEAHGIMNPDVMVTTCHNVGDLHGMFVVGFKKR